MREIQVALLDIWMSKIGGKMKTDKFGKIKHVGAVCQHPHICLSSGGFVFAAVCLLVSRIT